MAMIKVQQWQPDTHPGYLVEIEWEYDRDAGRDTGREHRGVSVRYPDGTHIHRDTHGADVAHAHYQALHAEHVVKNQAHALIAESLPADADKHAPSFNHLGGGRYEFTVPGIDDATRQEIAEKLARFGGRVVLTSI
jgi:hypothetical protein